MKRLIALIVLMFCLFSCKKEEEIKENITPSINNELNYVIENNYAYVKGYNVDDTELTIYKSVTINDFEYEVKGIKELAFKDSDIKKITIEEGIESIGKNAFYNSKIEEINLPNSIKKIEKGAFFNSNLKSINLPNITTIEELTFYGTKLENITIPSSVLEIKSQAFSNSNLRVLSFEENSKLQIIEGKAFEYNSNLRTISLPSSLNSLGNMAFLACTSLTDINLANIAIINSRCFYNCLSLRNVTLPINLRRIEEYAFGNCENLKTLNISNNIEYINNQAFDKCNIELKIDLTTLPFEANFSGNVKITLKK